MSNVTAENLRAKYKEFVDYVNQNKNNMTSRDWNNVEKVWDALNRQKNQVEANLSSEDNVAIGKLKVEYGALKSSYGVAEDVKEIGNDENKKK